MDDVLISKKELLSRYSISYGALYRWKRMGLIPEDWFIKKAAVTGQETFFPKALICERVELIQSREGEVSLEDLARLLNNAPERGAVLKVVTSYGSKSYSLEDITEVTVEFGDGKTIDFTAFIKKNNITEE